MDNDIEILETERLLLRPTTEADAEFFHTLANSPKWLQFIGDRGIQTVVDARVYIRERMVAQYLRLGYSNYTIIRKDDHQKIGTCGLFDREGLEGIDLGFAFLPDYEGKGYGFEAASKVMEVARGSFGIRNLKAITRPDNPGSQRLLEKLGFRQVGTTRLPNDEIELLVYQTESSRSL